MATRIAQTTLNASTLDILNVIRQNASLEYQSSVPVVTQATDIPKVGEIIYGTPAFANQFINALVNRIAAVRVQSANFNNPYSVLKKGYLEFGETVEEIFVNIARVYEYSAEKAEAREFKRTLPDVRSAFHTMNWRVVYPVTIQDEDLRLAFLSIDGVTNLIAKIVDQVYTGAEYDEFLLFKYMLIKGITGGNIGVKQISNAIGDIRDTAVDFRGTSNELMFMSRKFNGQGVLTNTPRDRQVIFMDARFNALFDVSVLAAAFNMDKADFMSRLFLIDNFTEFDNERFEVIRANSDGIEEVTDAELTAMGDVVAVILDENWFQVYDNNNKFTEKYVASGLYWNYFYHTWKTVSWSPYSNAIGFVSTAVSNPASITLTVDSVDISDEATVITFASSVPNIQLIQTEDLVEDGIAVQKYGALIIPHSKIAEDIVVVAKLGNTVYTAGETTIAGNDIQSGDTLTLEPESEGG